MNPPRTREAPGAPRPSRGVLATLALMTAVYVVDVALKHPPFIARHLALTPQLALGKEPWQLVTSAFVHFGFGALLSTALAFWFFGAPVEQRVGSRRLFEALGLATIVGSVLEAAIGRLVAPNLILAGAGPASMAAIAAFGVVYRDLPISLFGVSSMRASTCSVLFLGISAVFYLMSADFVGLAGGAAGAVTGAVVCLPAVDAVRSAPGRWRDRYRRWRVRRRYRVIPGGRDSRSYLN